MRETTDIQSPEDLLLELQQTSQLQARYAKRQYIMSLVTATASIMILILVMYTYASLIPRVNGLFANLETVMADMEIITDELAASNLEQMITNVDRLAVTSEQGIREALDKINAIDIDSLNLAIKSLSDVISPLAKFFGR